MHPQACLNGNSSVRCLNEVIAACSQSPMEGGVAAIARQKDDRCLAVSLDCPELLAQQGTVHPAAHLHTNQKNVDANRRCQSERLLTRFGLNEIVAFGFERF